MLPSNKTDVFLTSTFILTGTYMYIETSAPRSPGDTARLISPKLSSSTTAQCFTFWYHMYGVHIGSLMISVKQLSDKTNGTVVWTKMVQQGDRWVQGEATIPAQTDQYQVKSKIATAYRKGYSMSQC